MVPKRHKIIQSAPRKPVKMSTEYLGATAAFSTWTDIRPPCKRNLSSTTTGGNKFNGKEALVTPAAALQAASSRPAIRITEMKQAETTVDQLSRLRYGAPFPRSGDKIT